MVLYLEWEKSKAYGSGNKWFDIAVQVNLSFSDCFYFLNEIENEMRTGSVDCERSVKKIKSRNDRGQRYERIVQDPREMEEIMG